MEFPEHTIELKFRRKDFEEIYFKGDYSSILKSPSVKTPLITATTTLVVFTGWLVYSLVTDRGSWFLLFLATIFLIALIIYIQRASRIQKWRNEVKHYLDSLAVIKSFSLTLSNDALTLIQDERETICKWTSFTTASIESDHLSLNGPEKYVFPKKSMKSEEFSNFVEIVRSKIKNGL